jgi:hypothetical protein
MDPFEVVAYVSTARPGVGDADVATILTTARAFNRRQGITGCLVFDGGRFAQWLEGPAAAVEALLRRIDRDPRHDDLRLVLVRPADRRAFGGWSMAGVLAEAEGPPVLAPLLDALLADGEPTEDTVLPFFHVCAELATDRAAPVRSR